MHTTHEKGYTLILVLIFSIVLAIAGLGLYTSIKYITVEMQTETASIEAHYAALAGMRYAAILLRDPHAIGLDVVDDTYTVVGDELGGTSDFWAETGIDAGDLTVIITRQAGALFEINATCEY